VKTIGLGPFGQAMITTGGLGLMRPASGTWGSLPPVILAWVLISVGISPGNGAAATAVYHSALAAVLIVFSLACLTFGDAAEARWNRKDPGQVVADETAAMCLPLMFLPAGAINTMPRTVLTLLVAFLAFRLFDIWKPPPARNLQAVPGGGGILIDDLVAGVYALAVTQLFARLVL
jgi:phosphatidylglycerophosphatase A